LSQDSQVGVSKLPRLELPWFWGAITLHENLWWRWGLNQNCSPLRELSKGISHITCTQVNRVDFWFLMVGNQIANSTPGCSFGHNLCFKCSNGWYKPILDIYVPRTFPWYKELFKPLSFDPYNHPLKIQESTETPTPNVGIPLGVWGGIPSHFLTLPRACGMTPGFPFWPVTLQPIALVVSPGLGLQHLVFILSMLS